MKDGFTLRSFELLEQLHKQWEITLVAPSRSDESARSEPVQVEERIITPRLDTESHLVVSGTPVVTQAILDAVSRRRPDAILLWSLQGFSDLCDVQALPPIVLDLVDCMSLTCWKELAYLKSLRQRLSSFRALVRVALYERRVAKRYRAVTVVGEADARVLRLVTRQSNIFMVSNGVRVQRPRSPEDQDSGSVAVFSGVMEYPPNIDAAVYFATEILPLVQRRVPTAEFWIVGRSPVQEILELAEIKGVRVLSDVPDMPTTLRRCRVAVAPMRQGAGVKNKVLEAWAVGLPVVMTEHASNGLAIEGRNRALVTQSRESMVEAISWLLSDEAAASELGELARRHVALHHGWDEIGRRFHAILEEACA